MAARISCVLVALAACSGKSSAPATGPGAATVVGGSAVARGSAAAPTPAVTPPAPPPTPAPGGPPGVKVTLADVGLEAASLDRTVDPCVDFYQFACGGWLANNPIPADRARWSRLSELDQRNKVAIRKLLEAAAAGTATDPAAKQLGDYYAACMDEPAIERAGLAAIKPQLARTAKVGTAKAWQAALVELHKLGNPVVFGAGAEADLKDSRNAVTYLDAAGLGLPDRDYYLRPDFQDKRAAYQAHVARMLALAGAPRSEAGAADVVAIETEIAKLTKTAVEKRDIPALYNPTDARKLARQVRSIDWKGYWQALGVAPSKKLVVATPKFFANLDRLRKRFKPAQWASYFTYHLVAGMAFTLGKRFDDEAFALQRALTGVEQPQPRHERCIDSAGAYVRDLVGQQYAARHFPPAAKATANQLVDAILAVMGEHLAQLDWMSAPTKQVAQQKLGKLVRMIGYPETWRTYPFEIRRDDFAGNAMRAAVHETRRQLARAGKPVDRGEWHMNVEAANAYYNPAANNTVLPAGLLQPPYFGQDRSIAANLGGIGLVIGHELTHGFDDQGAQFDPDGNLDNWWAPEDAAKFAAKGKCVAAQYATFEAAPKQFVNGQLTLGENIADMGGVKLAFLAYRALRKDAAKRYVADGYSEDQQFFIAVAQAWCTKDRPAELQRRLTVDPHAPPKFRVYGALRNLPAFSAAFACAPGTPMNPASSCSVW